MITPLTLTRPAAIHCLARLFGVSGCFRSNHSNSGLTLVAAIELKPRLKDENESVGASTAGPHFSLCFEMGPFNLISGCAVVTKLSEWPCPCGADPRIDWRGPGRNPTHPVWVRVFWIFSGDKA
jgi:hypothetical protein